MVGRTSKSTRNVKTMTISKVVNLLFNFISRTFFIKYLGAEYLGVNGLFTNILTILSFAELGIGNAIIFKLYKPVANSNKEEIKTLLNFYKKVYYIIGIVVFIIGLCILPFINFFVKNTVDIRESIQLLFFMFLLNTSISYFYTYKRSIIIANQDEYLANIIDMVVSIISNIVKIIFLIVTKNYVLFLVLSILFTFIGNVVVSIFANKQYIYIKEKDFKKISNKEKKSIFNDVKSIILYKIGIILSTGTDNLIISRALGVVQVGLLSNYTIITNGISGLISSAFNSLTGSIGNLNTTNDGKQKEKVFYEILFLSFVIYGIISICVILLSNDFISIWLGSNYVLPFSISAALGFDIYVDGMRFVNYSFRNTAGLFKKGRFIPLISSVSNVLLSIIFVNYIGMFGVLIATGLTRLFIMTLYDPYLLHKYLFNTNIKNYYFKYIFYILLSIISLLICFSINKLIVIKGMLGFICHGIIDVVITLIIMLLFTFKSEEFKGLKNRFLKKG